jgi:hypothetical protein
MKSPSNRVITIGIVFQKSLSKKSTDLIQIPENEGCDDRYILGIEDPQSMSQMKELNVLPVRDMSNCEFFKNLRR